MDVGFWGNRQISPRLYTRIGVPLSFHYFCRSGVKKRCSDTSSRCAGGEDDIELNNPFVTSSHFCYEQVVTHPQATLHNEKGHSTTKPYDWPRLYNHLALNASAGCCDDTPKHRPHTMPGSIADGAQAIDFRTIWGINSHSTLSGNSKQTTRPEMESSYLLYLRNPFSLCDTGRGDALWMWSPWGHQVCVK